MNTKNYLNDTGQLIIIEARKTFLKIIFPWVLVNILIEDPHHLSDPENISLGIIGNIKVVNRNIHSKEIQRVMSLFHLKRGLLSNMKSYWRQFILCFHQK